MSQQINLLSPLLRQHPSSYRSAKLIACGLCAAVLLMIAAGIYEQSELHATESRARSIDRALRETQAEHDKVMNEQRAGGAGSAREAELSALAERLKDRLQIVDALRTGAVGTTTGFSSYMLAFSRQSVAGLWLTGFDISAGGREISMKGRALSADLVPVYLEHLKREAPMQGRSFGSMLINLSVPAAERVAEQNSRDAPPPKGRAPEVRTVEFVISSREAGGDASEDRARPPLPANRAIEPTAAPAAARAAPTGDVRK